jgi:hypothetical protein
LQRTHQTEKERKRIPKIEGQVQIPIDSCQKIKKIILYASIARRKGIHYSSAGEGLQHIVTSARWIDMKHPSINLKEEMPLRRMH